MSYTKQTIISGAKNGAFNCAIMRGHWSIDSVKRNADRRGVVLSKVTHNIVDNSGHGRGGVSKVLFEA